MIYLLASTLLTIGGSPDRQPPVPGQLTSSTVCELKKRAALGRHEALLTSVTAIAYYDFEHGFFLAEIGCDDPVDGTGVLRIDLPARNAPEDFPELNKLASQSWLAKSAGKSPLCTCVGIATFDGGSVTFVLREAKAVWALER